MNFLGLLRKSMIIPALLKVREFVERSICPATAVKYVQLVGSRRETTVRRELFLVL